jgi:gamma-butyrobetaine dioxygenase
LAYGTSAVPEPSRILSVQLKERDLSLEWNNNGWVDLPYIYLRDNCQEPESFKRQRLFHAAFTIDLNIQAKQAEVKEDGRLVIITWPDGHRSRFPSEWLAEYCRGKHNVSGQLDVEKVYWGSDFYDSMPRFDFSMLMKDDKSLLEYLIALESHGLVLIENVGLQKQQTKALCDRIYYPKPCIYGKDVMKVESKPNPSHIAYSGVELPLHNDFVYTDHTSGVCQLWLVLLFKRY